MLPPENRLKKEKEIKRALAGKIAAGGAALSLRAAATDLPAGALWVFTQPQFLLLNVAVGGNWPGRPEATTVFPQRMFVDYVRVYQKR